MNKIDVTNSFRLLHKDFKVILEYIEPNDSNIKTYSHRLYELFLRASTEFENICKNMLIKNDDSNSSGSYTIKDYARIIGNSSFKDIENCYVEISIWQPNPVKIEPFKDWKKNNFLQWYRDYNEVKHNREKEFKKANLENVILGISSIVILLFKLYGSKFFNPNSFSSSIGSASMPEYRSSCIEDTFYVVFWQK